MTAAPFDTLKLSRQLRERSRFDQEQAESLAEALAEAFHEQIATKTDLQTAVKDLQGELKFEQRLTIKTGAMPAGLLFALPLVVGFAAHAKAQENPPKACGIKPNAHLTCNRIRKYNECVFVEAYSEVERMILQCMILQCMILQCMIHLPGCSEG